MSTNKNIRQRIKSSNVDPKTSDPLLEQEHVRDEPSFIESVFLSRNKIKWQWAPVFLGFWMLLYCCISIPAFHHLPEPLSIKDEARYPDRFIAERAEINLRKLIDLGPRVVGSVENEQKSIKYFLDNVQKLKENLNPVHEIETDLQIVSGSYILLGMVNMYQGVQNFIIKIGPKGYNGTSYLLVNSHFDTVPCGPGAGDDGTMVVVMLETLRVLSRQKDPLRHPVVFLFNGAEENPLQAAHGFITQHKWAKYCKALINLDSAGNGGREILFQSGPNHPWLMKSYKRAAMHPYASTVAEEMFQNNFMPSDTDFRIFRDHGRVPGLDMAHSYNGYVYHTRFDLPHIIPRGTFQNTGDNLLSLVREIANAPELDDPSKYSEGHTIFFDFLGYFLVFYTQTEGIILNVLVSLTAFGLIFYSFRLMAYNAGVKFEKFLRRAMYTMAVQIIAVIFSTALCIFVAIFLDKAHMPLSWFTNSWLIFGLYFCTLFFGLGIVPAIYFQKTKDDRIPIGQRVQLLLHCKILFVAFVTIVATICNIRSVFMLTITVLFYTAGLIVNLATKFYKRPIAWIIPHIICSIPPFLLYTYLVHVFYVTFIPMAGRFGAGVNPELLICSFSVAVGLMTGGLLIPVLNLFNKSKTIICSFIGITFLFIILAATPLGFPYRPETNVQRFSILHVHRVFRDANDAVRRVESGYYINPMDRRTYSVKEHVMNMTMARSLQPDCKNEMLCGLPLFNHRWHKARDYSLWIPAPDPQLGTLPQVKLLEKKRISETTTRYEMELSGPDHMGLFIRPLEDAKVSAWSFHKTPLRLHWEPPYFIYFSYGVVNTPLKFWLELEKPSGEWSKPTFEIGIAGHWNHHEEMWTPDFKKFLASFPKYTDPISWPASYESRLF